MVETILDSKLEVLYIEGLRGKLWIQMKKS